MISITEYVYNYEHAHNVNESLTKQKINNCIPCEHIYNVLETDKGDVNCYTEVYNSLTEFTKKCDINEYVYGSDEMNFFNLVLWGLCLAWNKNIEDYMESGTSRYKHVNPSKNKTALGGFMSRRMQIIKADLFNPYDYSLFGKEIDLDSSSTYLQNTADDANIEVSDLLDFYKLWVYNNYELFELFVKILSKNRLTLGNPDDFYDNEEFK